MEGRLKYVDCLRGFCMLLVVYHHLVIFGLSGYTSELDRLFVSFRMPMFFFISGFVSHSLKNPWSLPRFCKCVKKKMLGQLLPSFFILYVFCMFMKLDYWEGLGNELKYGFWFTFAAFGIYIIYAFIEYISEVTAKNNIIVMFIGWTVAFTLCLIHQFYTKHTSNTLVGLFSLNSITYYYFFFYLGVTAKKNKMKMHSVMNSNFQFLIFIIALVPIGYSIYMSLLVKLARVLIVYNIFYQYREFWEKDRMAKYLEYIGRHTLEVYFLHTFFLFGMPHIVNILNDIGNVKMEIVSGCTGLVEFVIIVFLSLVVTGLCICVRKIIDTIPVLSFLCFGPKKNNTSVKK